MLVKICGITHLDDALMAVEAGADLLGFICYPKSPRYIPPVDIAAILAAMHSSQARIRTVGVFVNESLANVRHILQQTGLDLAQLHGDEPPAFVQELAGRAFKALRPTTLAKAASDASDYAPLGPPSGPDLLIDAYHPRAYGGTGRQGDWRIAASLARRYRILLAGGLTPANVAEAIAQVQPWGIDVSSGVEQVPGIKNPTAVRALITAAKNASLPA